MVREYFHVPEGSSGKFYHTLEQALALDGIAADGGKSKHSFGPMILQIEFCRGDVIFAVEPGQDGFDDAALFFQRSTAREAEV